MDRLETTVMADEDILWTNISPINGFSLTPSTGSTGVLKYKVQHNVLYVSVRGVVIPELSPANPTSFVELPFAIPQNAIAGFIGPNLSTSLYAKEVCTIQSTGTELKKYSNNSWRPFFRNVYHSYEIKEHRKKIWKFY
ncbi:hypothetical protein P7I11_05360 [Lactococcus lactis]|nr:hypothetical protein [Lactococcus lactis]